MTPKVSRVAAAVVAVIAMVGLGTKATAAGTTTERHTVFADSFWSKTEKVKGGYRISSWGLYVFRGTEGTTQEAFAQLYHDVQKCERPLDEGTEAKRHAKGRHPVQKNKCVIKEAFDGTGDSSGAYFTIDETNLNAAHLDTTIDLVSRNKKGEPTGAPVPTHVVADWTGRGDLASSDGTSNFHDGTCTRTETFQDANREADATATIGTTALGATPFASLGWSSGTSHVEGDCEEGPVPV